MAEAKIQFTPAQAAAIQARGGSLLVSAAAGSGKTRVLVERVAGLITDPDHPVDADSLLIMTFTNAAAAKLRADITKRLAAEIRQHPQDVRLRRQQMRLQRASIGTVDAFCLHFVQQNFSALDVPPDFTIADDATLVRLQQETLSTVLEQAYTDPDFCAFADLYDRGRTDDTTGRAVQELYHFTQALPHPAQALRVAGSAVIVVDAKAGIEVGTELAWDYASHAELPRAFFINKCDDPEARFSRVFHELREQFGISVCPVLIPILENDKIRVYLYFL